MIAYGSVCLCPIEGALKQGRGTLRTPGHLARGKVLGGAQYVFKYRGEEDTCVGGRAREEGAFACGHPGEVTTFGGGIR